VTTALVVLGVLAGVYAALLLALVLAGRGQDARAAARFVPDCLVLFRRLAGDPRVPRRQKALLAGLVAYLAMPIDLVPDFIPVAGQLDDAILVLLVLRSLIARSGDAIVREHWPGPAAGLELLLRAAR
jgi:uncharacterized membrane protein YkvA (DUF1232 family)